MSNFKFNQNSFFTISKTAEIIGVQSHVLRFWEKKFSFLKPKKSQSGRRYYSNQDIVNLEIIQDLLHNKGYTISGAIRYIRNNNQLEHNKLDQLNVNNEAVVKKINETSDLILNAKRILDKYSL